MSSGVIPNDDCKPAFDKVRLGKVKYVTYKIDDKAEKTEVCAIGETKVWCYYSIWFCFCSSCAPIIVILLRTREPRSLFQQSDTKRLSYLFFSQLLFTNAYRRSSNLKNSSRYSRKRSLDTRFSIGTWPRTTAGSLVSYFLSVGFRTRVKRRRRCCTLRRSRVYETPWAGCTWIIKRRIWTTWRKRFSPWKRLGSRQRKRERERESTYIAQHIYKKMANETMRVFIFAQTREKESARERERPYPYTYNKTRYF